MLGKIPIRLNIQSTEINVDEVTRRFRSSKLFCPKRLCDNYFSLIVAAILDGSDPIGIIQDCIPDIDGQIHIELVVADNRTGGAAVFVYTRDMTDQAFEMECDRVRSEIILDMSRRERTPLSIIRSLMQSSSITAENANLQFVTGDYRGALAGYAAIAKQFPELSRRMCEVCHILLDERTVGEPLAFDVLMVAQRYDELYELSGSLPFDARVAVRYYLKDKDIGVKRQMIVLNLCYDDFGVTGNREKADGCKSELVRMVEATVSTETWNMPFWEEYLSVL